MRVAKTVPSPERATPLGELTHLPRSRRVLCNVAPFGASENGLSGSPRSPGAYATGLYDIAPVRGLSIFLFPSTEPG